jgi:hypothetical protein
LRPNADASEFDDSLKRRSKLEIPSFDTPNLVGWPNVRADHLRPRGFRSDRRVEPLAEPGKKRIELLRNDFGGTSAGPLRSEMQFFSRSA